MPFLASLFLATLWALASPVFSVPDENAHATKAIAQLQGQYVGERVPGVRHLVVDLPPGDEYQQQILCFATRPDVSADCGAELGDAEGVAWFASWVSTYNPTYYFLVGWPSLFLDGSAGVYAMRIVSAVLAAIFIAWAHQAAVSARHRNWMPLGLAFLVSPMIVYFAGAVNPQGLEIATAAALWVSLLRLMQTYVGRDEILLPRWYLWFIVTLSAALLANARALGPLWVVVVVAAVLIYSGWRPTKALFSNRESYLWLVPLALAGVFSLWWTLRGGSLSGQAEESDAPLVNGSFLQGFAYMIRHTAMFAQQAVGYFGWFDTPLPTLSFSLYLAALVLLIALAVTGTDRRSVVTIGALMASALLIPALVQGYSVGQTGIIWQGRYGLFLYIGLPLVAAHLLSARAPRLWFLAPRITAVGIALLSLFSIIAFVVAMRRYVIGMDDPITKMIGSPEWQPPLTWPVLVAGYVLATLGFGIWTIRESVTSTIPDLKRSPGSVSQGV